MKPSLAPWGNKFLFAWFLHFGVLFKAKMCSLPKRWLFKLMIVSAVKLPKEK